LGAGFDAFYSAWFEAVVQRIRYGASHRSKNSIKGITSFAALEVAVHRLKYFSLVKYMASL
jgi:hypothetical protein